MQFLDNAGPDQPVHPLTESMDTIVYVNEQRILRSDCMDVYTDLNLQCSHIT